MLLWRNLANIFEPDIGAEPERGGGHQQGDSHRGGSDDTPAPRHDKHDGQQQPELRLDGKNAEQDAGKNRLPIEVG